MAVFQIITLILLPHLTELDLPAPHEDLKADFYTGLKDIVATRLNSQVDALRSITLRSLTTLDNDIRSWLQENVPETIFLRLNSNRVGFLAHRFSVSISTLVVYHLVPLSGAVYLIDQTPNEFVSPVIT